MRDTGKYLIHAAIAADGIVERSDVVGAIYGQTEGLIGEELDLRRLQESSKLGRIDVELETADGKSVGEITVSTSLDRVETATLAAALETIDRVGPCRATVEVTDLEDVRAARRREVIERAERLLVEEFEETTSEAIVDEVRRRVATADVTTYEDLPAGPRVPDADALVIVEGRADVQAVLAAGVKNAVAVEGTDVPEAVAELTLDRTATAFLDGDRGGELILRELQQLGDLDYVAFAPPERSVEDLSRSEVHAALRSKVPVDEVADASAAREVADAARARPSGGVVAGESAEDAAPAEADARNQAAGTEPADLDESDAEQTASADVDAGAPADPDAEVATPAGADDPGSGGEAAGAPADSRGAATDSTVAETEVDADVDPDVDAGVVAAEVAEGADAAAPTGTDPTDDATVADADSAVAGAADATAAEAADAPGAEPDASPDDATDGEPAPPRSLRDHVEAVAGSGDARLLDEDATELETVSASGAFDALRGADAVPAVVVLDGELDQRLLDLAAQRGVREVVADAFGAFTKRPTDVRIRTVEELLAD